MELEPSCKAGVSQCGCRQKGACPLNALVVGDFLSLESSTAAKEGGRAGGRGGLERGSV